MQNATGNSTTSTNINRMKQEENPLQRVRKTPSANGSQSQKMMNFRLDLDLLDWLSTKPNKGRYINDLIREDRDKAQAL